jgi:hypothetical protein
MTAESTVLERRTDTGQRRTRHGKLRLMTLDALDKRTAAAQRAKQLVGAIEKELRCGDDDEEPLSVKQQQFAMHAAFLGAMIENFAARWLLGEKIDLLAYSQLINTQRRVLEEL